MDLRSVLNEDVDDRRSVSSHPSQPPQSRQVQASTPTSATSNSPYAFSRGPPQGQHEYPFPPSFAPTPSSRSESRASHTPQPQRLHTTFSPIKAPPHPSASSGMPSQYGHSASTPTSSMNSAQYPPPHQYMPSPSPSREPAHTPHAHQATPTLTRTASYQSQYGGPAPYPYPTTPHARHAAHSGPRYPDTHAATLQHQASSAVSHQYSQNPNVGTQSPQQMRPRASPTGPYPGHAVSHGTHDNRQRDQSASVSPKSMPLQRETSSSHSQSLQSPRPRGTYYSFPDGYTGAKQPQYSASAPADDKPASSGNDSPHTRSRSPGTVKSRPQTQGGDTPTDLPTTSPQAKRKSSGSARPPDFGDTSAPTRAQSLSLRPASPAKAHAEPMSIDQPSIPDSRPIRPPSEHAQRLPRKRRRIKAPPIWAQAGKGTTRIKPSILRPSGPPPPSQHTKPVQHATSQIRTKSNGHNDPSLSVPLAGQPFNSSGPLGPWEYSITNVEPFNDLTRQVANFLFDNVVRNEGFAAGGAGETPSSQGQLEIEAKIGRITDKRTGERLRLPVRNEVVLDEVLDVAFESFMDDTRHSAYNNFLNEALLRSRDIDPVTKRARIPIHYVHTREIDKFYGLPDAEIAALPPAVQTAIARSPRHKRRVRVTRKEDTGEVIAQIIKIRLADLHVFSPNTEFDWRISVSFEANWEGNVSSLSDETSMLERRKDRVSYKHLAFQVDLTQVTGDSLTHELEVELSSAEVRKQGMLVRDRAEDDYETLVRTFMDNIRILARFKKS